MSSPDRTPTSRDEGDASELEGGGTGQNWGQGEGRHEPTIPRDEERRSEEPAPATYPRGSATPGDDATPPLVRDDEGMDR